MLLSCLCLLRLDLQKIPAVKKRVKTAAEKVRRQMWRKKERSGSLVIPTISLKSNQSAVKGLLSTNIPL